MKYDRRRFKFNSREARSRLLANSFEFNGHRYLLDPYNGRFIDVHFETWHAEHLVPLKSAWENGFSGLWGENWSAAQVAMTRFANDPGNLIPVSGSSNMSRSDKSLWNWAPLNLAYVPTRNAAVREMYAKYGLALTKPQKWALDWSDVKIRRKYKHGILLGRTRAWLLQKGFHRVLMPY